MLQTVIAFLAANYQQIFAVIGEVVLAATAIVRLTPSQKDDAILGKVIKFLDFFSVVAPKKSLKK